MRRMSKAAYEAQAAAIQAWHDERKRWYPVTKDGTPVKPGDIITSFRGEAYQFDLVTAHPEGNSQGKITVRRPNGEPVLGGEYFPHVFDLTLVRREDA